MYPIYCRYLACPCNHIGTRTDISVLKAKGFPNFLQPHLLQVQLPPRNLIIQLESERVPSMCERSAKFLHQQHPTRSVYLLLLNIFNIFSNGQSPFLKVPHVCTKRANINCYPQLNSRFFSLVTVTALYKLFGLLRFRSNSYRWYFNIGLTKKWKHYSALSLWNSLVAITFILGPVGKCK